MAVIYADVLARLDERSAKAAADELEKQFNDSAARVGSTSSDALGKSFTDKMPGHGRDAGDGFMAGLADGIGQGMPGVGSSLSTITTAMRGIGEGGAAAGAVAAAGIGVIAVAALKVGEALYGVGERFDAMADTVAIRTGKMGDDLDGLTESIRNVARESASSLEAVADIGARLSQSLDLTGAPLEDLTKQIADLNRMTGESLDIRRFGMMLRGFGEDGRMAGDDLDALTAASQRTGIPLGDLVSTLQTAGPAARSLGLNLEETAGLIVAFEKAGVDANKTTAGLSKAAQQFAEHNINLETGLQDTITQIRGFIDAGNDAAAIDLAGKVFGVRSAQAFVDAIRQGTLSVGTLKDGLGETGGTIEKLNDRTSDWAEQWDILKNRVSDLAAEAGGPLFDALNSALGVLNDILTPQGAYPSSAPPWAAPGTPANGQNLPGILGGPATSNTPSTLDGILLPSDTAVPGQVIPPWMTLPGGPHDPQDVAGALAAPGSGSAAPSAPQIPYGAGYGQPPAPGESDEQWRARMADMAAQHDLAEKRARLTQLEQDNTTDANALIAAKNAVIDAEMRSWETEHRYLDTRAQAAAATVVPYSDAYGAGPRSGQTASQYSAEGSFLEAQHKTAQAAATYQQLMASGTATTEKLAEAHNNLVKAQRDENEASLRLSESYKQTSQQLGEIGNQLDADFGISKGLAGIAENLTRFLAGLAFAPVIGALRGVQEANGGYDAKTMGSGMFGLGGLAMGMGPQAAGMPISATPGAPGLPGVGDGGAGPLPFGGSVGGATSVFVVNMPSGGFGGGGGGGGYAQMGTPYGSVPSGMAASGYPGSPTALPGESARNFAHRAMMPFWQSQGLQVGDHAADKYGEHQNGALDVMVPDIATGNSVLQQMLTDPNVYGAIFNNQTYGYGHGPTPQNYSAGHTGDPSTDHLNHVHGWYKPGGANNLGVRGGGTGGGIGPGMAGLPQSAPFGPVGGPASPSQSVMGGRAYGQGTAASGGLGFGGGLMGMAGSAISGAAGLATSGAAMGMDGGMGGAAVSAIAQIGIQEAQRAIGAAAQYGGAIAGGLLETFSLNDSALGDPSKSWLGKIAGAVAGVRPSLPNSAGKEGGAQNPNMAEGGKAKDQPPGPLTPEQSAEQKAADAANAGQGGGTTNTVNNNVNVTNQGATEDYTGQVIQSHLGAQATAGQPR